MSSAIAKPKKVLFVCCVWPEPTSSAAGIRTRQLLEAFRASGDLVAVVSPCQPNRFQEALTQFGFETTQLEANSSVFDTYVQAFNPDIVVFDRFIIEEQFSWRVKSVCPDALRVLDTIDLHSLRRTREEQFKKPRSREATAPLSTDTLRELAAIFRSDVTLMVSDFELEFLVHTYEIPRSALELCRFSYSEVTVGKAFHERENLVAIGNFNHAPNRDAFSFLHRELWPTLKDLFTANGLPKVELHIYGAYLTNEFLALDNARSGFRVKGWCEDARDTLSNYRLNLAPLRFGAGIKGKISDGWSVGTPCIASATAAEGMTQDLPFGGAVSTNWDSFSQSALTLYTDPKEWQVAHKASMHIIRTLYRAAEHEDRIVAATKLWLLELQKSRSRNAIGQILWQQQFRSTEFFSRWIEAKNQNKA